MPARIARSALLLPAAGALALAYLISAPGYGYFRDEFYYIACGEHLAFGYVDHPPLIGLVAAAVSATLGHSLFAIRLVPSLAAGALFWLTGACAAELGGRRFAQLGGALALSLAGVIVALCSCLSMNPLELALWGLAFWILLRVLRAPSTRLWLGLGAVLGVALENKLDTLALGVGLAVALVICRRDLLRTRGPYLAGLLALACGLPHLGWQLQHDWPTLEFIHNARAYKMVPLSPLGFVGAQLVLLNPFNAPLWMLGLGSLLRSRFARPLAITFVTVFAVLVLGGGKPYYAAALYLPLFAAGATALERHRRWRVALLSLICLGGVAALPFAKPVLPVQQFIRYQRALGVEPPGSGERHAVGPLPQLFADMHGWTEMVTTVGKVHAALPPSRRANACVLAENYGQAGAVDLLGPALGLPRAISGHNSYWLWGPRDCTGETVIVLGRSRERLEQVFTTVTLAATHHSALGMPFENDKPIFVASGLRVPMAELWAAVKHYE